MTESILDLENSITETIRSIMPALLQQDLEIHRLNTEFWDRWFASARARHRDQVGKDTVNCEPIMLHGFPVVRYDTLKFGAKFTQPRYLIGDRDKMKCYIKTADGDCSLRTGKIYSPHSMDSLVVRVNISCEPVGRPK